MEVKSCFDLKLKVFQKQIFWKIKIFVIYQISPSFSN